MHTKEAFHFKVLNWQYRALEMASARYGTPVSHMINNIILEHKDYGLDKYSGCENDEWQLVTVYTCDSGLLKLASGLANTRYLSSYMRQLLFGDEADAGRKTRPCYVGAGSEVVRYSTWLPEHEYLAIKHCAMDNNVTIGNVLASAITGNPYPLEPLSIRSENPKKILHTRISMARVQSVKQKAREAGMLQGRYIASLVFPLRETA